MYDKLYEAVAGMVTWPRVALLFVLALLMMGVFELRRKALGTELLTLDGRKTGYTPREAGQVFEAIGSDGRALYANTELTLDLAFPLVYGSLMVSLLILLYGRYAKYLVLVPAAAVLMDIAENVTIAIMIWVYNKQPEPRPDPPLAKLSSVFTQAKWALSIISLVLIGIGVVLLVLNALKRRKRAGAAGS
ncbi:MAG TPA: hypothetical protein VJ715_01475 [Pyrinomonadaceae bacterium]|nr:hypothetical protein [Pyrinomonadaceae bacterium]